VPEPAEKFARFGKGFNQLGWVVEFERMQWVGDQQLPQKITVLNRQAKLKLIIDQWDLENAGSK
jgi:outer membrane biogenesis lipoprotein LolB